jgi:PTH1 family peptidyl-tRNA hydrolase
MANQNDIWLIAGLGNPEAKYDGTRHNAGFAALDALAAKWGIAVNKTKFQGLYGQGDVGGRKVLLLKPLTYMNLLCDDITQAPGKLRIRPSGSAGGHNGLKSIIARLGGENFPRIRIGVGAKPHPDYDLAAWVLGHFSEEEAKALTGRFDDIAAAAVLIMDGKLSDAQSRYNH